MRNWIIFAFLLILLAACSKAGTESTDTTISPAVAAANDTAVGSSTAETDNEPGAAESVTAPVDTASLDVCALLPEAAVTAVTGPLREAPQAAEFIGDERGCTYVTEEGLLYTVLTVPLDRWEIMTAVLTNATAVPDLGDEALLLEQSGDSTLYVLLDGLAVVQVYNTTSDTAVSTQLARLALDVLAPK